MIPTAKDFAILFKHKPTHTWEQKLASVMVEFAKLHVTEALKEASEKAETTTESHWSGEQEFIYVDRASILNSYPLDNIK